MDKSLADKVSHSDVARMEQDLLTMKARVASELSGAKFLWTSGSLQDNHWIPWDVQLLNATPNIITWRKSTPSIHIRLPGLYHISLAVFTMVPTLIHIYLNDEPLLFHQPITSSPSISSSAAAAAEVISLVGTGDGNIRRLRHSAGEVTSVSIDEYVSLPPEARLSVRYQASTVAQAFFSIRKL